MPDNEEAIAIVATCRAVDCDNGNVPIHLYTPALDVLTLCGVCSNEITDIIVAPADPEELPTEIPAWLA